MDGLNNKPEDISAEKKEKNMKIVCSGCGKEMGFKEGEGITHSLCDDCAEKSREEIRKYKESLR